MRLLLMLGVLAAAAAAAQTNSSSTNGASGTGSKLAPERFFWPPSPGTGRCVAPGSAPRLQLSLPQLMAGLQAKDSYVADASPLYDGLWTALVNTDDMADGMARVGVMRERLQAKNLHHAYLSGRLTGNLANAGQVPCGRDTRTVRTLDGSCNYPDDPLAGAAGTRFGRNVPLSAVVRPDAADLLRPNPLLVSAKLLQRRSIDYPTVPFLNIWAAAWVQFMIHDWFVHGEPDNTSPISMPIPAEHSLAGIASTMTVGATPRDPTRTAEEEAAGLPPTALNKGTHWWDASQIYGSDAATAARLREGTGGRLKLTPGGLLPLSQRSGAGDAGVTQNWWLGLELLHTLFAREHNAIAAALTAAYPAWNDQALFDRARMINAAVLAKLHTTEWTPAILPNKNLAACMRANWAGVVSMLSPLEAAGVGVFSPPPNELLYGYRNGPRVDAGVTYSMTEEFTSVYRMHMLLPESLELRGADGSSRGRLWTRDATLAGARAVMERTPLADLAATFGAGHPGALALHNYPLFMTNISLPGNLGALDLAALDVLRDRERGVPRYNAFRRLLQLRPLSSIADLTSDPAARAALEEVYGGDIEAVDLLPGTLAEDRRPDCFGFGETQFQVFILMASRRLAADRFFGADFTPDIYTPEGMAWIDGATFKSVLLRHMPELADAGVGIPDNAYNPWTLPEAGARGRGAPHSPARADDEPRGAARCEGA